MDQNIEEKYLAYDDVSKSYKYGFTSDPLDKKPYEISARCYHCTASFLLDSQVKGFINSKKVLNMSQQNIKMVIKNCQCNRDIPGCAVCFAPIGILNYQVELMKNKSM